MVIFRIVTRLTVCSCGEDPEFEEPVVNTYKNLDISSLLCDYGVRDNFVIVA